MAKFEKGNKGKPIGAKNKLTKTVKEVFEQVFSEIQSDPKIKLSAFAKSNPKEFYQICAKLIPTAMSVDAKVENVEKQEITLPGGAKITV